MTKWIIGIIVIILAAAALWWSGWLKMGSTGPTSQTATSTPQTQTAPQPENGMSATNDASNAALMQDAAAIDAQIQGLGTDSANVDSSLNDKPVSQSY